MRHGLVLISVLGCSGEPPEETTTPGPIGPNAGADLGDVREGLSVDVDFELVGDSPSAGGPRSIVLISLDTVRADRMSTYGGPAQVAQIDALAAQGVVFEQAISHFPETCLSHWSMMSGVLPQVHGNVPAYGGSLYSGPTLAELASHQGLATGAFIGGVTLQDEACGIARGFDHYDDQFQVDPKDMRRPAREVTSAAVEWISAQEGPYFAFVHYFDAHFPYTPPAPWDSAYDPDYTGRLTGSDADLRAYRDGDAVPSERDLEHILALYDGEISALDAELKDLLDALGPDVIVAITSDHGESFEHDYYFNHRAALWDSVIRVPLIIRAPDALAGTRVDSQVGLMDLTPTLLELAGLQRDRRMQGQSLTTFAEGGSQQQWRQRVYSITDPWMPEPQFAVRTLQEKVIEQEDRTLVYDLLADPAEESPKMGIPKHLASSRDQYSHLIASLEKYQVEEPQNRQLDREECEQLEALGYQSGGCQQLGPPGPPPGGERGRGGGPPPGGGPQGPAPGQPGGPSR